MRSTCLARPPGLHVFPGGQRNCRDYARRGNRAGAVGEHTGQGGSRTPRGPGATRARFTTQEVAAEFSFPPAAFLRGRRTFPPGASPVHRVGNSGGRKPTREGSADCRPQCSGDLMNRLLAELLQSCPPTLHDRRTPASTALHAPPYRCKLYPNHNSRRPVRRPFTLEREGAE